MSCNLMSRQERRAEIIGYNIGQAIVFFLIWYCWVAPVHDALDRIESRIAALEAKL